jgi:hypothetical protein
MKWFTRKLLLKARTFMNNRNYRGVSHIISIKNVTEYFNI